MVKMKKTLKILAIIFISIIGLYTLFIIEESIRLKNGGEKPLIVIGGECSRTKLNTESSYKTTCKGLGYTIKREYSLGGQVGEVEKGYLLIGEEFWLFDKIIVWGWIA